MIFRLFAMANSTPDTISRDGNSDGINEKKNNVVDVEAISVTSDDALLLAMGKKPELKRVYNFWTCTYCTQFNHVYRIYRICS